MPVFYDKFFKPSKTKGLANLYRCKRNEWHPKQEIFDKQEIFEKYVPIKDVEDHMIRQFFKTKKKSLTNQRVSKK